MYLLTCAYLKYSKRIRHSKWQLKVKALIPQRKGDDSSCGIMACLSVDLFLRSEFNRNAPPMKVVAEHFGKSTNDFDIDILRQIFLNDILSERLIRAEYRHQI